MRSQCNEVPCLGAGVGVGGSLFGEVQCIMGNGQVGPTPPVLNRMTNTTKNITFLQLRWPQVIIYRNVKNYKINTDSNLVLALRLLFLGGTGGVISAAFCPCDTVDVPST